MSDAGGKCDVLVIAAVACLGLLTVAVKVIKGISRCGLISRPKKHDKVAWQQVIPEAVAAVAAAAQLGGAGCATLDNGSCCRIHERHYHEQAAVCVNSRHATLPVSSLACQRRREC
jgi:hypothetical protein